MVVRWWARSCAFGWLVIACGPSSGEPGHGDTTSAGDDTSGPGPITADDVDASTAVDPSAADSTTSAATETTTSTPGTDESDTGGGSESTGGAPASVCDPQPQDVEEHLNIDPDTERFEISIDAPCLVESVASIGAEKTRFELLCDEGGDEVAHVLDIHAAPGEYFTLGAGVTVHLRAEEGIPTDYGGYEHIVVRLEDGTLLAAMMGSTFAPDGVDLSTWFAPFSYEMLTDVCEPEPYEPPPADFIQDPCPTQDQRAAFELSDDARESIVVHDANEASFSYYRIYVPWAKVYHPQGGECPQRPFTSGRFVILHEPTPT